MSLSSFARKLVSGDKARFKDEQLGVDLDLAYLTDRIIMMGYPASGMAAFYRNDGEDVVKFLGHRHQDKYWVYNFCPLNENSYPASMFGGRVSRYPFPDHHAPPLAILALATREMHDYLQGDPERVVVLHCKAGKGRTGTLACAYLLSTGEVPTAPKLQRSYTSKQWAQFRAEKLIRAVDSEESDASDAGENPNSSGRSSDSKSGRIPTPIPGTSTGSNDGGVVTTTSTSEKTNISQASLEKILALHTARRMKAPEKEDEKAKRGVSIASQRRFLYYWSLLVLASKDVPKPFWCIPPLPQDQRPKVYLKEIRVRLRESSGVGRTAIKVINSALEVVGNNREKEKGKGDIWVSLARYDDAFVEVLEEWERRTRAPNTMGRNKGGDSNPSEGEIATEQGWDIGKHGIFADGKWDSAKMVKSFARLGAYEKDADLVEEAEGKKVEVHVLRPLPPSTWVNIETPIQTARVNGELDNSSTTDLQGASETELEEGGIILEAGREVRAKLYMGEVPFGWFWFIPIFHMPNRETSSSDTQVCQLTFIRKEVDFALGPGTWLIDVTLKLTWASEEDWEIAPRPPQKSQSGDKTRELVVGALAEGDISGLPEAIQGEKATQQRDMVVL